jgi:hypothetical protein
MKLIPMRTKLDLAILPIGSNFTMDVDDALIASDFLDCDKVLGYHFDTFGYIEINHDQAKRKFFDSGKDLMLLEIGESIAAALTGTLFGVFSAYAMFAPVARILEQNAATNVRPYEAVKEILIAYYSNFSPLVAVEYGRKVLYTDQRPSMTELSDSKFNG